MTPSTTPVIPTTFPKGGHSISLISAATPPQKSPPPPSSPSLSFIAFLISAPNSDRSPIVLLVGSDCGSVLTGSGSGFSVSEVVASIANWVVLIFVVLVMGLEKIDLGLICEEEEEEEEEEGLGEGILGNCKHSLDYALSVFTQIHDPQTRISNRVLRELSWSSEPEKTLLVYEKLRRDGSGIDRFGVPPLLKASSRVEALIEGMEFHGFAAKLETEQPREALELFNEMQVWGIKPDQVAMLSVVSACAHLGTLDRAKWIHKYVNEHRFGEALPVNNALIDISVGRANLLREALELVEQMPLAPIVIIWGSLMAACRVHNDFELGKFATKRLLELDPDPVGRANLLREALELVEQMPLAPIVIIWGSLMAACRVHNDFELGKFAAKWLLELDPDHDGAHVLLSNIYAKERRREDVGEIHEFFMADRNHKQADEIYTKLDEVVGELKLVGYAPNACDVLVDIDEDKKTNGFMAQREVSSLLRSDERGKGDERSDC
ncbi:pentatricopeptide repeat (PPR) superfamily protein [Actinidia rufa]|uniref:Pentatricopeptide repeat (PPR) superfamily protein n=1 Tax=Actinidia rufa TaxID=165716 RepID=A0A7J0DLB4_9ERIC|nr:pentatricopeptide repeat (PPR) superfamily protein [Actinidia rufa]